MTILGTALLPARPSGPRTASRPATGHAAIGHPTTNRPATGHPATGHPATGHPATGHPATGHPTTNRPATGHAATGRRPAADSLTAGHPSRGRAAVVPGLARRARLVALAVGGFLLPWCVLLGLTLPATAQAQHWSLAWAGLDGAEALAALATAVLLGRGDPRAALTAAAGGTLLLADAWFDVCTSGPGLDHALAVAEAACPELPLAGAAFWLALCLTRRLASGTGRSSARTRCPGGCRATSAVMRQGCAVDPAPTSLSRPV